MISVPVIDLSQLNSSSEADRADIVAQLMKAATEIGFLQVSSSHRVKLAVLYSVL